MSFQKHRLMAFLCVMLSYVCYIPTSLAAGNTCAILLHGLGRTHYSMSFLGSTLKQHDYWVVNRDYPSTKKSIDVLAEQYVQPMVDACIKHHAERIVFVTHSLGGIVLQKYLADHEVPQLTHVVMLSPPHHGSPIVDKLSDYWIFKALLGPAGQALSSVEQPKYMLQYPRRYRVGIIAGSTNFTPVSRYFFKEPNDGKVSVASAYLQGVDDFRVLPVGHTFMMNNRTVQDSILHFLRTQTFRP